MAKKLRKKGSPRYLGIDPGKKGWLCVLDECGDILAMWAIPYLDDEPDIPRLIKMFRALKLGNCVYTLLEEQHAFHREGPAGAFTNGGGYMTLKTSLHWAGLKFKTILPEKWKRLMDIPIPSVPKAKLPPKPVLKKKHAAWNKACKKITDKRSRIVKKKRKDLACRMAQELAPGYDFRTSQAWNAKINDGKCEAFLVARLAYQTATRSSGDDGDDD